MDHIKDDPGLRISLDRFSPNIRDDVRFAYIEMGPTQPMCPSFPSNKDERCFRAAWYKDFEWFEYSVSKKKAYCHYCFLFKHDRMDDKFGYEVFSKLGYEHSVSPNIRDDVRFAYIEMGQLASTICQRQHMKISKIKG
uniref:TTF-type domain-containing protein n=1 Tax=Aegilops tauschii subsp. strangulata TaxID=200361 RepID=A0A453GKS6_AEGTS